MLCSRYASFPVVIRLPYDVMLTHRAILLTPKVYSGCEAHNKLTTYSVNNMQTLPFLLSVPGSLHPRYFICLANYAATIEIVELEVCCYASLTLRGYLGFANHLITCYSALFVLIGMSDCYANICQVAVASRSIYRTPMLKDILSWYF